ncbi:MAG TPA: hypothetical protein VFN21_03975 [Acidimicrobiales bacterium]|nr:hypothetical protein [Acidimicrobiales bacterium]
MRFARLAVEAQGRTLDVAFHPNLTVITGVGSASRGSMINELLSGLCTHRSGTHLEVVTDDGRMLVVFRPGDAPHRVIDVASGSDVSAEFTSVDGSIDLLATFGMDAGATRRWARIGPNDLVATTQSQELISRLGRIDQNQLWSDAQRVQIARRALAEHTDVGEVEDASLTERIEHNYHSHDAAMEQADRTRLFALVVGTASLAAAAVTASTSGAAAIALVVLAAAATVVAFVFRARVGYYAKQLEVALNQSGSESYLGYQLDRIDGYITSEQQRRHRAAGQADVDDALHRWKQTAGDVTVDWALEHRPAIEAAAGLGRRGSATFSGDQSLVPRHARDEAPELIETLITRIAKSRRLGTDGESFPLLLDEPFGAFDPAVRPALLETLLGQAGSPQVILLTNSDDIVSWARLEELTGDLSLVGPGEGTARDRSENAAGDTSAGRPPTVDTELDDRRR